MKKQFLIILALATAMAAWAHEYILLAEKYKLQKGDDLELHLFVADGFNVQGERPFQKAPTKAFELITKNSVENLITNDGALPIVTRKINFDGGGLIHLERNYARISLATEKFFDYLKEDHIEGIAPQVDKTKGEQKERYTRYIKCLVQSGEDFSDTLYKQRIGQELEIVLLQNPYRLRAGSLLRAQVFFRDKPLVNKVITARNRAGNEATLALNARTDKNGICDFTLKRRGEWFLHATHMIACPDKTDSDWESFWVSYSFGIAE